MDKEKAPNDVCPQCGSKVEELIVEYYDLDVGEKKIKKGDRYRITEWKCKKCGYSTYKKEKIE